MVQQEKATPGGDVTGQNAILTVLAKIIKGDDEHRIRRTHTGKIRDGKEPGALSFSSTKRSFAATVFLGHHGTPSKLVELVEKNLVTRGDLEDFLARTRLAQFNKGRVESALSQLQNAAERKAAEAAAHSGGGETTGELSEMLAEAGHPPLTATITNPERRRLARSRQ